MDLAAINIDIVQGFEKVLFLSVKSEEDKKNQYINKINRKQG